MSAPATVIVCRLPAGAFELALGSRTKAMTKLTAALTPAAALAGGMLAIELTAEVRNSENFISEFGKR